MLEEITGCEIKPPLSKGVASLRVEQARNAMGGTPMKNYLRMAVPAMALAATIFGSAVTAARPDDLIVGVSWSNFQEERWKTDEAAIKAALAAAGAKYISADAQIDPTKQLNDGQSLIAGGAQGLSIPAQDATAIEPAITQALNEGIPVVGYDRLIENPGAYYLTFDNKEVGRMQ